MRLSIQLYTDMIASSQSLARDARGWWDPLSVFAEAADGAGTAHSGAHGGHRLPLSRWEAAGARRQQARAPAAAQGTSARARGDRAAGSFRPCDTVQRLNGRWGRSPSPPPRAEWIDGCRQPFQPVAATVPSLQRAADQRKRPRAAGLHGAARHISQWQFHSKTSSRSRLSVLTTAFYRHRIRSPSRWI